MASTYLQRTFSTPTSRKIFTVSLWFKRTSLGSTQNLFGNGTGTNTDGFGLIDFLSDDRLRVTETPDYATSNYDVYTSRKFRDTSAWYHVVVAMDTTQATASNRIKIYTNGQLETSLDTASYPSLNLDTKITLNNSHIIGRRVNSATDYFNGNMAHYHFIDGTAYDASTFGETDADSGIWKPKTSPSVTYGTNGFFLKFGNSASLGTDSSGNANNFTLSGSGTQTLDTPSNVFATWNPLIVSSITLSNGNLLGTATTTAWGSFASTLAVTSGKYYWETKPNIISGNAFYMLGIVKYDGTSKDIGYTNTGAISGVSLNGVAYYSDAGFIQINNTNTSYGSSYTSGDIIGIALDLDNNYLYVSKNGTWQNSADPSAGTGGYSLSSWNTGYPVAPAFSIARDGASDQCNLSTNFGNGYFGTTAVATPESDSAGIGKFEYSVPSGYYALCTKNIATYG